VFVFSPSLLLVNANFSWSEFVIAFLGCVIGITALGAALSGFMLVRTKVWEQVLLVIAAILLVVPEIYSSLLGLALLVPVLMRQFTVMKQPQLA
jgi:TRAP-type uncharacterized transport system fused permease subunit